MLRKRLDSMYIEPETIETEPTIEVEEPKQSRKDKKQKPVKKAKKHRFIKFLGVLVVLGVIGNALPEPEPKQEPEAVVEEETFDIKEQSRDNLINTTQFMYIQDWTTGDWVAVDNNGVEYIMPELGKFESLHIKMRSDFGSYRDTEERVITVYIDGYEMAERKDSKLEAMGGIIVFDTVGWHTIELVEYKDNEIINYFRTNIKLVKQF